MEWQESSCKVANTTRRVCNLTAEEAQKKRSIDRDNQRHHRAKNRAYVHSLEQKVSELTGRVLMMENLLKEYQQRDSVAHKPPSTASHSLATIPTMSSTSTSQSTTSSQAVGFNTTEAAVEWNGGVEEVLDWLPLQLGNGVTVHSFDLFQGLEVSDLASDLTIDFLAPTLDHSRANGALNDAFTSEWNISSPESHIPDWHILPLNTPPTIKLDEVIKNTTEIWQAREFERQHELNKPAFPGISSLLNRQANFGQGSSGSFSDAVAAQIWRTPIKTLPERMGFMYVLSHLIRWLVCRNKHTYEEMPVFLRPTVLQRTVPHGAWVDSIVWPKARDAIIKHMDCSRFEEFRSLVGSSLSVNWPYPDSAAFIESPDKTTLMIHPVFEAHIRKAENWSIGKEAGEAFPFLIPFCKDV